LNNVFIDLCPTRSKVDRVLQAAMLNALEIHSSTITGIALDHKEYPDGADWDVSRHTAIDFLYKVFMSDGDNIRRILSTMGQQALDARSRKAKDSSDYFPKMLFATQLWKKTYATATSRDIYGIVILMRGMMRFAHLPTPRGNAWGYTDLSFWEPEGKWAGTITSITGAMKTMKNGFGDKVTTFVAVSPPSTLKALFDTVRVPEAVIRLLLCSDDDVHDAIIGLVQNIFDQVEERVDCFRAMLLHFPAQSMVALQDYLERWIQDAQSLPTAVESARWLVRCFTDILEVLCRQSGAGSGLAFLRDPVFLEIRTAKGKMSDEVTGLWNCMTKALSVIIRRTPRWAPFYDNEEMVDWMQDALIFGRLLVEENRTFEGAAQGTAIITAESPAIEAPNKVSLVGDQMIVQLEQILDSLMSWLRLTEIETLHQTYELLKSLLDRLTKGRSNQSISDSLMKSFITVDGFCRRSKRHKTKLNDSELAELAVLIKPFMKPEDDSDVEYVSSSVAVPTVKGKERESSKVKTKTDAFTKLMQNAEKGALPQRIDAKTTSAKTTPASSPVIIDVDDIDDDFGDDFLAGLDADTLEDMERSASNREAQKKLQKSQGHKLPDMFKKSGVPGSKPLIKPTPKPVAPVVRGSGLLSQIRREVVADHRGKQPARQIDPDILKRLNKPTIPPPRAKTPSETSSSSDSDEEDGGLEALKRLQKASAAKTKLTVLPPRAKLVTLSRPEMSPAERQRLNAQRTKARLKPDMTMLWSTMLKWDPSQRDFPDKLPTKISGKFRDVQEYSRTYMPLFFRELRDQSLNEMSESSDPVRLTVEVASRQHTDDFIDLELSIVGTIPNMWYLNEFDTCLLSFDGKTILVKVQSFKRNARNVTLHIRMDVSRDSPSLSVKSRCQLRKHMNMSTAAREFAALKGLPFYEPELLDSILEAKPTTLPEIPRVTWEKAMIAYNVNEPQAKAIIGSMRVKGFALIQGPPGTGKTKTISGLAGRFMTERPTHISLHGSGKTVNAKLLICAPSNAAIDEVTRRLKDGVPTSDGKMVIPQIVRLGAESSMNAAVKDVSLDSLIEARVSSVRAKGGDNDVNIKRVELALDEIRQKREAKQAELAMAGDDVERRQQIESELATLVQQRIVKSKEMNKYRDAARDSGRQLDGARREARERILQDADIICSTLAGAGHDSIASFQFETVIIDEAAQSVEPSALVPLKYGCTRCILVGGKSLIGVRSRFAL
jgi:senataxin